MAEQPNLTLCIDILLTLGRLEVPQLWEQLKKVAGYKQT